MAPARHAKRLARWMWDEARLSGYAPSLKWTKGRPMVAGFLTAPSGLGEGARLTLRALEEGGYAPAALDLTPHIQPERVILPPPDSAPDDGLGPIILHVNPPELPRTLALLRSQLHKRRLVGFWAWELPEAPPSWRPAAARLHAIWTPSAFAAGAFHKSEFRSFAGEPVRPVGYPIYATPDDQPGFRESVARWRVETQTSEPGRFLAVAAGDMRSSLERKNLAGAVAAFGRAFADDPSAHLLVKITGGDSAAARAVVSGAPNAVAIARETTAVDAAGLWAAADVVVSLHRAEGYGLTLAQALAHGTPVVMTGWSGNLEFAGCPGAFLAPASFTPVRDPYGIYTQSSSWAEPDIDAAAVLLRRLRAMDAGVRADLSARSRAAMGRIASASRFLDRLDLDTRAAMLPASEQSATGPAASPKAQSSDTDAAA